MKLITTNLLNRFWKNGVKPIKDDLNTLSASIGKTYLPHGNYSGNVDTLKDASHAGVYFINASNASGVQPFASGHYFLSVLASATNNVVQCAYKYSDGTLYTRMYMNGQWYAWTEMQKRIPNVELHSKGYSANMDDGGYEINTSVDRWRLHANGANAWIHRFIDGVVNQTFLFGGDGTFGARKIADASGHVLSDKQNVITGGATTITTANLTANRALISNASGKVAVSAVTSTELGYLDGVTSNVQSQLNTKVSNNSSPTFKAIELSTGTPFIDFHFNNDSSDFTARLAMFSDSVLTLQGASMGVDNGTFMSKSTGAHLMAANNSYSVYAHGKDVRCTNIAGSAYIPVYASAFSQQSSRKVKENIQPISEQEADKVLDLEIVKFDYIKGQKNQCGVIAEDTYNVLPDIVIGDIQADEDGSTIGVDYSKIVPYLVKKVQMMQKEIERLNTCLSSGNGSDE